MCSIAAVVECFQEAGVEVCNAQLLIAEIGLPEEEERAGERADKFVGEFEDAFKDICVDQFGVDTNLPKLTGYIHAAVCFREAGVEVCNAQLLIAEIGFAEEEEHVDERADKFVGEFEDSIEDISEDQFGVDTNIPKLSGYAGSAVILCRGNPLEVDSMPVHQVRVLMVAHHTLRACTMPGVSNQQVA